MRFVVIEIAEISNAAKAMLRLRPERATSFTGDIYPESAIPPELDYLKPGRTYGRFHEEILRREVRRDGIPKWFDPQNREGQMGIISPDGHRCYIEFRLDHEARNAPSTFESRLIDLAEDDPEQTSLFAV